MSSMKTITLGSKGPVVSALGLGLMGMSDFYTGADRNESLATVHAALDAGVTLLDTGDFYGSGHNEMLLAEALESSTTKREDVFIQVKFGLLREPSGKPFGFDGSPKAVKTFLTYSLRRLRTDYIDLYMPARVDPQVPIEETVGAIAEMVEKGHVRHIGLSEANTETLRKASSVHPIAAVQAEYSLISREPEAALLPALHELGGGLTAYGVLSRGLLSGRIRKADDLSPQDYRAHLPRFQGENLAANLKLVDRLMEVAEARGVTASQLAIAWVAHRGQAVIPLIGARRRDQLADAVAAMSIALSDEELGALEEAVPHHAVAGTRYDAMGMRMVEL